MDTRRDAAVCPTDDEAVTPRKQWDKQSVDYLWRSGLAGGMAGCAVSSLNPLISLQLYLTVFILTVLSRPNH
jgi:hypothetical protein